MYQKDNIICLMFDIVANLTYNKTHIELPKPQ